MQEIITGFEIHCLTNWAKLVFTFKSETFRTLHSYAALILDERDILSAKGEVLHKNQFKDPLAST